MVIIVDADGDDELVISVDPGDDGDGIELNAEC